MKELLEEFCRLAPKEWLAERSEHYITIGFPGFPFLTVDTLSDASSALALIHLLDWLEGQEVDPAVCYDRGLRPCAQYECILDDSRDLEARTVTHGKTRIEAVVRAVVAVLEGGGK